jgi:hypothetical protein
MAKPSPAMTGARGTARVVLPQKAEPAYRECRGVDKARVRAGAEQRANKC